MLSSPLLEAVLPHALRTDRIAVEVPETGLTVSYGALVDQVDALAQDLASAGIADARVALVMPNELGALVVALAIAGQATCIPLNPAYTKAELRHYLATTRAAAIVAPLATPAALAAAAALGLTEIGAGGAIRTVFGALPRQHRSVELRRFLECIDRETPADLGLHLILDSYATHKTLLVLRWLLLDPRLRVRLTSTYSSWIKGRAVVLRAHPRATAARHALQRPELE